MTRKTTKAHAVRRRGSIIEVQGARGVSYKLKFDVPSDARGERRTHYKTIQGTREEAEAALARLTGQAGRGVDLEAGRQTLSGWIDSWLEDHIRHVSQRTLERYRQLLRRHVKLEIGDQPLATLGPLHIERLYNHLAERLAPRTVNHVHQVLSQCLKDAKRLRIIPDNPAEDVRRRRTKAPRGADAGMRVLPIDGLFKLFDHAKAAQSKNAPYELVLLAFDSGARRGELMALRWSDFDADKRTIRISRAVDETQAYGVTIKDSPKNESSRRTITLSVQTVAALRDLWKQQAETRLRLGARLPQDALVFPLDIDAPSEPLRPRQVSKSFRRIARRAGFEGFRFHDLRHCCASHMLAAGRSVPEVSRHLGHSTPAVTMSIYAHAIPRADGGAGLLDELMPAAAE